MPTEREYVTTPAAVRARKRRAEMSEEQRLRARRMAQRAKYLRELGKPLWVNPEEAERARRKLRAFHDSGMPYDLMSRLSGLSRGPISDFMNGRHKTLCRDSYNLIMALRFELPAQPQSFRESARVCPIGTQRRLQALWADGWPTKLLAEMLGMKRANLVTLACVSSRTRMTVHHVTHTEVKALYEKLRGGDPRDHGVTNFGVSVAKSWARKKGCIPSHCWDEDTLDNPDAWPEWTGACGTTRGYKIHMREGIPICPNCHTAKMIYRRFPSLAHRMGITEPTKSKRHGPTANTTPNSRKARDPHA